MIIFNIVFNIIWEYLNWTDLFIYNLQINETSQYWVPNNWSKKKIEYNLQQYDKINRVTENKVKD